MYHSRLVEITSRIDFLWNVKADKEYEEVAETRQYNSQLLKNILPSHVANYFLAPSGTNARKNEVNDYI